MVTPICRTNPDRSVDVSAEINTATNLVAILRGTGLSGLHEMAHPWLALVIRAYTAYLNAPTPDEATKQLGEFSNNLDKLDLTKPAYDRALRNIRNLLASEIRHPENCDRVDALLAKINPKLPEEEKAGEDELRDDPPDRIQPQPPPPADLPPFRLNALRVNFGLFDSTINQAFVDSTLVPELIYSNPADWDISLRAITEIPSVGLHPTLEVNIREFQPGGTADARWRSFSVTGGFTDPNSGPTFGNRRWNIGFFRNSWWGLGIASSKAIEVHGSDQGVPEGSVTSFRLVNTSDTISARLGPVELSATLFDSDVYLHLSDGGRVDNCAGHFCNQADFLKGITRNSLRYGISYWFNDSSSGGSNDNAPFGENERYFMTGDLLTSMAKSWQTYRADAIFIDAKYAIVPDTLGSAASKDTVGTLQTARGALVFMDGFTGGWTRAAGLERVIRHGDAADIATIGSIHGAWVLTNIIGAATVDELPSKEEFFAGEGGYFFDHGTRALKYRMPVTLVETALGVTGGLNLLGKPLTLDEDIMVMATSPYFLSRYGIFVAGFILVWIPVPLVGGECKDGFAGCSMFTYNFPYDGSTTEVDLSDPKITDREGHMASVIGAGAAAMGFASRGITGQLMAKVKKDVATGETIIEDRGAISFFLMPDEGRFPVQGYIGYQAPFYGAIKLLTGQ